MQKQCTQCHKTFQISSDDLEYYKRIKVPEPTWCPQCREMRRMAWCNEGKLYSNKCRLCNKNVISQLPSSNPRPVYCIDCWWGDKYDPLKYGKNIDWDKSIIDQIHDLELVVPHACVSTDISNVNSEYTHHAGQEKDCYLLFHATFAEDCYYGYGVKKAKNCVDTYYCHSSELCYECTHIKENCYGLGWCQDCAKCSTSYFLRDCTGCMDCFMCIGLRNKQYYFYNKQLSKEEYQKKITNINLGSFKESQKYLTDFQELQKKHAFRYVQTNRTENSLGDYLYNAKDAQYCFDCSDIEQSKYCSQMQLGVKNCYDIYQYGINAELCYEGAMVGTDAYDNKFCYLCLWKVSDLTYCLESYCSHECFGCYGLNKNKYCILNKQYTEQEYFNLKEKLINKMIADKEYGEFFPIKYSQSAYNETSASWWYPKTKEEVMANGWQWFDENKASDLTQNKIINLPDDIKDCDYSITQEILTCKKCQKKYKIIPRELEFYQQQKFPLPRKCFSCRHLERQSLRNPHSLWHRQCMKPDCHNTFETTYSPDRKELVYCEECYKREIY